MTNKFEPCIKGNLYSPTVVGAYDEHSHSHQVRYAHPSASLRARLARALHALANRLNAPVHDPHGPYALAIGWNLSVPVIVVGAHAANNHGQSIIIDRLEIRPARCPRPKHWGGP